MPDAACWRPVCSLELLKHRAELNARIRQFFAQREVLEVETPLLGRRTVTDPALQPFATVFRLPGHASGQALYLQTSPEFAMKRLLAAGATSIYQIGKAFRNQERGRQHNPEFTLLEWYRLGFSLHDLMAEAEALVNAAAAGGRQLLPPERLTYADAFSHYLGANPCSASLEDFARIAESRGLVDARALCGTHRANWLDLLFSYYVQPHLGQQRLTSIYHYPAVLPSLARHCPADGRYVERVEIFLAGMELGNGFHELADPCEQERRFAADLDQRRRQGLPLPDPDERLLAALRHGLPDCSGMAIGLDRLLMTLTESAELAEVLAFPVQNA